MLDQTLMYNALKDESARREVTEQI